MFESSSAQGALAQPSPDSPIPSERLAAHGTEESLFRHRKREGWGLAIVDRQFDDRTSFMFQDGKRRTFRQEYLHMLEVVDRPHDVTSRLVAALKSMSGASVAKHSRGFIKPISLDEQVSLFRAQFPAGFTDGAYIERHRGSEGKKSLKRHRDALVERGHALDRRSLRALLDAHDYVAIHQQASATLNATDLVAAKERKQFAAISGEHLEGLANSLFALLHGSSPLTLRLDVFVRTLEQALGTPPSWNMATALLAASRPTEWVLVQPKLIAQQARWMAPGLRLSAHPGGVLYIRLLDMAEQLQTSLGSVGHPPKDLLDVITFIQLTLSPKARKEILTARQHHSPTRSKTPAAAEQQEEEVAAA